MFAALGAFGSVGCLLLLLYVFFGHWIRSTDKTTIFEAAAYLSLAAILLASIGGFGSLFNFFVSKEIRCYNRISVYIAFFSFFGAALLMERLLRRSHIIIFGSACGALVYLGVTDQASFDYIKSLRERSAQQYDEVKQIVAQAEQILPRGAKVYQLPYTPYPNTPLVEKMVSHSHLLAYTVSHHLHWSWPTLTGLGIAFNQRLENLSSNNLVKTLEEFGFSAIYIDTFAYADRSEGQLVNLEKITRTKRIISPEGRYALIVLPRKADNLLKGITEEQYRDAVDGMLNVRSGDVIDFSARGHSQQYILAGWSLQEPNFRWSEGSTAQLKFIFGSPPTSDLLLVARASGFVTEKNPVVGVAVLANDTRIGEWKFNFGDGGKEFTCRIAASLFHGSNKLKITFDITGAVSPLALGVGGDPRVLGIALEEIRFAAVK